MHIIVTVPDELSAQAQARGISVEAFVQSLVEEARLRSLSPSQPRTPEEIEAFFAAMAEGSQELPSLPTEELHARELLPGSQLSDGLLGRYQCTAAVCEAR
jgi:hypothetical protein